MNSSTSNDVFRGLRGQVEDLFTPENFEKGEAMNLAVSELCSPRNLDAQSQEVLALVSGRGMTSEQALERHVKIVDGQVQAISGSGQLETADEDVEIVTVTITRSRSDLLASTTELFEFRRGGTSDDDIR